MEQNLVSPGEIAGFYKNIIKAFKNRADVQNGTIVGYHNNQNPEEKLEFKNWPVSGVGTGMGTTGFCVSASQAFLTDKCFQLGLQCRNAKAKLISIDIKEQYYGNCYSGSQNKWHTAIFLEDSGINLVIDLTCRQFGNKFINKDIWDYKTWESTFRHPLCRHKITNFIGNEINYNPVLKFVVNKEFTNADQVDTLKDITTINDNDRLLFSNFLNEIDFINNKLTTGNITVPEYKRITEVNELLKHFPFKFESNTENKYYSILEFVSKTAALDWIKGFIENQFISKTYFLASDTIQKSLKYNNIPEENFNIESKSDIETTYVVLEFSGIMGPDISCLPLLNFILPFGINYTCDVESIVNGGKKFIGSESFNQLKKLNTLWLTLSNVVNV